MDADMEIDFSLDYDEPDMGRLDAEPAEMEEVRQDEAQMRDVQQTTEEGEIDTHASQPTKVHIRGLDNLTTQDIHNYVQEHHGTGSDLFKKVEWVDDTSANLVYDTEEAAADALDALSAEYTTDPLALRNAKPLITHPNTPLQVRQAVHSDVKAPRAREKSRFYLMNPEHDPDEIRKRKRKREEPGEHGRRYRRRDNHYGRQKDADETPFDVNLYDDNDEALDARRKSTSSHSSAPPENRAGRPGRAPRSDSDLFSNKRERRLRSASPGRYEDGRYGYADDEGHRQNTARHLPTPPAGPRSSNRAARDSIRIELFPGKVTNSSNNSEPIELFPNKKFNTRHLDSDASTLNGRLRDPSYLNEPREPFPNSPNHRRQDAQDLKLIEVAERLGGYNLDGQSASHTYRRSGRAPTAPQKKGGDLFSRITGGPPLNRRPSQEDDSVTGFKVKGTGNTDIKIKGAGGTSIKGRAGDMEENFSILGASKQNTPNPLVKELFPDKLVRKTLLGTDLASRIQGHGKGRGRGKRAAAEDLF